MDLSAGADRPLIVWSTGSSYRGGRGLGTDPTNPHTVPNPFGDRSEIRFPDYAPPAWLATPPNGEVSEVDVDQGGLEAPVPVQLWSPASLSPDAAAPLLVAHDGSGLAQIRVAAVMGVRACCRRPDPRRPARPGTGVSRLVVLRQPGLSRPPDRRGPAGAPRPGQRLRGRRARGQSRRRGHDDVAAETPERCRRPRLAVGQLLHPCSRSPGIRLPLLRPDLRRGASRCTRIRPSAAYRCC